MAESNTPFSSLDALGSGYGGIEAPNLDEKSLSPFEGERLSMPTPDFSKSQHFVPVVPGSDNLDNKQQPIHQIVGNPAQKPATSKRLSPKEFGKALAAKGDAVIQANQDKNEYSRIYSYDAGPGGNAFYDRYKAYGQETFDKIGFHPFRDNEAVFNAGTSGWQDTKRMMGHAFWPLFSRGFVSGPKSLVKMFQGDFSADTEDAEFYSRAAAIGNSTKGGVGGFLNNTAMSFGYTAGIITEAVLEEALAIGVTALTGGGAAPAAFVATANVGKNLARGLRGLEYAADGMKAVNATIKGVESVGAARRFWNAARESTAVSKTARFLNPLEHLTDAASKIYKNENNLTGLARLTDAGRKTVGGFYGEVRGINMALSEARLEGGMKQNDVYNKLYDTYYAKHKEAPSDALQQDMMNTAKEAGISTLQWNTALIFMSNKIVLDNIVGVKGRGASFLAAKTKDVLNLEGGKIARTTVKQTLKSGKKILAPVLNWRKQTLVNTLKSFAKDPIRKSVTGGISYFKKNITEALQENAQDVIAQATESYYIDSFSNDKLATYDYAMGLTKSAIKGQFTGQGFETFASGFVMGMFAAPLNGVPHLLNIGYNKVKNPKEYAEYAAIRDTYGKNLVNELSNVDMADFWNANAIGLGMQAGAETVRLTGTEKQSRDAADASFNKAMIRAADNDMLFHYKETLESYKDLTAEEFEEAVPSVPAGEGAKYLEKLDTVISKIDRIEQKHEYYKKNFPNPINLSQLNKNSADYNDAVTTHHAWNVAVGNAVFLNESFDNTMERMSSIVKDITSNGPLKKATFNDINVLFDNKKLINEVDMLETNIESLKTLPKTAENTNKIAIQTKKLETLKNYRDELNVYLQLDRNKKNIINQFKKENPDASIEELEEEYDEVHSEQKDKLEAVYKDYLKVLAKESNDHIFNKDIDESFVKLIDFHSLENESQALVENINLLHNPKEFVEHVQRNKVWMKNLYDNRREYYEALKDQEFDKKEDNDLLNGLASRGLYISVDDFQMWQQFGITPEEIYNDVNKTVIKRSHPDYDEIIAPFVNIAQIRSKKSNTTVNSEAVQAELDRLEQMEAARISELETFEVKTETGTLTDVTIKEINDELEAGEYADTEYTSEEDVPGNLTLYKDIDILKVDNIDGAPIDIKSFRALYGINKFDKVTTYTLSNQPNADEVETIKNEFNKLRQDVIDKSIQKGTQDMEPILEKPIELITNETPLSSMPVELNNDLVAAFESFATFNDIDITNQDDYDAAIESYIRSNFEAASIIEEYNKNQQLEKATKSTDEGYEIPRLNIGNELVSAEDLSESVLRGYLKNHEVGLSELEAKPDKTSEDDLQISQYKLFISRLTDYLDRRAQEGFSPEQKVTVDAIQKIITENAKIKRTSLGYELDGVVMERVTNVINQFKEKYQHVNTDEITISFKTTLQKDGLTAESIKAFIDNLRVQKGLSGFSEFTYTEVEKELTSILNKGEEISNEELLTTVLGLVAEKTNEASRIAGNYLDDQIRHLFDNKATVFNEDNISKEAYDNLFSTDPDNQGYLVDIKELIDSKGLHIISRGYGNNGVILYDKEAKVAGEVDLLAVDRSGKVFIIDVKTGKASKWNNFNNENAKFPQKPGYTLQQLAYSNLLFNLSGLKANISILPVEIDYNKETGKVTDANKPKSKTLLEPGSYRIPLFPTQEQIDQIDSVIPKKAEAKTEDDVQRETSEEGTSPAVTAQQEGTPKETETGVEPELAKAISQASVEQLAVFKQAIAKAIAKNAFTSEAVKELQDLLDIREQELAENAVTKLTENNIEVDTRLISKEVIFTGKTNTNLFASQGSEVRVVSINQDKETVLLKSIGAIVRQKTISFAELDKLFILKQTVMEGTETPIVKTTEKEKEFIEESSDNVKNLLVDSARKTELKNEIKGESIEQLDTALFEDTTSDC